MHRKTFFLTIFLIFLSNITNAQTITFSTPLGNGGTSILDGDLGSSNIGNFEITSELSGADLFLINDTFFAPLLGLSPDSDGLSLSANTGIVISTTDNSLFSFEGFSFLDY